VFWSFEVMAPVPEIPQEVAAASPRFAWIHSKKPFILGVRFRLQELS
jgi:hypothetical protein